MIRWTKRVKHRRARTRRPPGATEGFPRLTLESLEDRIAPATALAPPTLLDPTAAIRVDQDSYTIRGALQVAAKDNTTVSAYRDSNANGAYDAGVDRLAASAAVAKKTTSFALRVNL